MTTIVGCMIIVVALVYAFYAAQKNTANKATFVVLIFAITGGILIIISDRISELPLGPGSVKAQVSKALSDPTFIQDLKAKIEAQRDTLDIVSRSANEARQLANEAQKFVNEIANKNIQAGEKISQLDNMIDVYSLVMRAQNDDGFSFDKLSKMIDEKQPHEKIVDLAVLNIRLDYTNPISKGYLNISWKDGVDPKMFPKEEYQALIVEVPPIGHADLAHWIDRSTIPRREKMFLYIQMIQKSGSLAARDFAGKFFTKEAGDAALVWEPFKVAPLIEWWNSHKKEV